MWHAVAGFLPARPDERRFTALLAASALLHALLITLVKLPPRDPAGTGYPVLSVVLKKLAPAPAAASAEPAQPATVHSRPPPPVITEAVNPSAAAKPLTPPAAPAISPTPPPVPASRTAATARPASVPPAPGRDAHELAAAGGVNARLVIGEQGRIRSILWDRLPALTNEQFQRLEALLRENEYPHAPAGSTLTEMVDVRGLLGLPPVRRAAIEPSP